MGAQWKAKVREAGAIAKGKIFSKLSKEITVAARSGADPEHNSRLKLVVEQARKASMPRETLERALKKAASGADKNENYEVLTFEGFAPHRVPVIIECLTDNVNRTLPEIRVLFRKGQLGASGSVSWDFEHLGFIEATPANAEADVEVAAIEAGAQDFEPVVEGTATFYTEPTDLDLVCKALPAHGFTVDSAKIGWRAKNPVALGEAEAKEVEAFLAALNDHDDVQNLYVGLAG